VELPSTATAMYGSTVRTAIAALAVGALGTLGLAVLAEVITRRREARPTAAADPAMSDAASNGSRKTGWAGILPALRLMGGEAAEQERSTQERSQERSQEPARRKTTQLELSRQESAWKKAARTFRGEPSSESPAGNGHRRPTTHRSP
jgi:hypothetical protein